MTSREISPGELAEDLAELKQGVRAIAEKFDRLDQSYLRRDLADERYARRDSDIAALRGEVADIKARAVWAVRAALTGVLFPIIVAVVVLLLSRGR